MVTKHDILGTSFTLLSYREVMTTVGQWRAHEQHHYITLSPPHTVLLCRRDSELHKATAGATLTLPDGVGIILAARLLRYRHRGRVTGPTLMLRLCDWGRADEFRHFFYGGAPGVAEMLGERLSARFPGLIVAGTCCPPFRPLTPREDREAIEQINAARPDIVWVGLGSPKQEKWMAEHVERVQAPALVGVGAAFDFHSGLVKRAPPWMRAVGLEWVYRTLQEPRRIGPKSLDNILFCLLVARACASPRNLWESIFRHQGSDPVKGRQ